MEVHHHTHTPGMKWSHYFWEFFMLFLAITLGFFVENKREHYIEHKREKEYIKQLVQDLKTDTAFFSVSLESNSTNQQSMDTLIGLLKNYKNEAPAENLYYLARNITSRGISPKYSTRTFEQMKNSGMLRLVRNSLVLDSISLYYESLKDLDIRLEHRLQRLYSLFIANEELFDGWELTAIADSGFIKPFHSPPLLTAERSVISRYITRLGYYKATDKIIIEKIKHEYLPAAMRLIVLLKKEYKLK